LTFTVFNPPSTVERINSLMQSAAESTSSASVASSPSLATPTVSADKRYAVVVLASTDGATEVPGTPENIFVRDTCTGAPAGCVPSVILASIGLNNNPADGDSISPSISADGRYVAFLSSAMNLVDSDTNGVMDVFVRDTCAGAPSGCAPSTQRVSVATDGAQANGASTSATIGATGRYITFESAATNLGSSSSSATGIFLRDTCAGAAEPCTPSTQPLD
jgi:Tol biopolymer transport system component